MINCKHMRCLFWTYSIILDQKLHKIVNFRCSYWLAKDAAKTAQKVCPKLKYLHHARQSFVQLSLYILWGLLLWGILLWESLLWGYCYGVLLWGSLLWCIAMGISAIIDCHGVLLSQKWTISKWFRRSTVSQQLTTWFE